MTPLFAFGIGPMEIAIVVVLGVLFFGKKLPSIGHSIGRTVVEFKNGIRGVEEDLEAGAPRATPTPPRVNAPKFDSPST